MCIMSGVPKTAIPTALWLVCSILSGHDPADQAFCVHVVPKNPLRSNIARCQASGIGSVTAKSKVYVIMRSFIALDHSPCCSLTQLPAVLPKLPLPALIALGTVSKQSPR
jgi:hypothetical protein